MGIDDYKEFIEATLLNLFPNAILIIERNSYGLALIEYFMKNPEIERRMYRRTK